jgi:hypothetical protein
MSMTRAGELFPPHSNYNQPYATDQGDRAQHGWNGNCLRLRVSYLDRTGINILLLVRERKTAKSKAYDTHDDKDYSNYCCWFHDSPSVRSVVPVSGGQAKRSERGLDARSQRQSGVELTDSSFCSSNDAFDRTLSAAPYMCSLLV